MRLRTRLHPFAAAISITITAALMALPAAPVVPGAGRGPAALPVLPAPIAVAAPATGPAASVSMVSPFGVAGVMRWPDWGTFQLPADTFAQTGATWVREDFVWGLIQPAPDRFQWTATDRIVAATRQRNINILGIISYSASWATPTRDDDASPVSYYPPDPGSYYSFVRTLVARYRDSVHYWEVWNEPDNPLFWKPAPNPAQYAEVLKTAYRAIKDADPTAKVLSGGVSGNAIPFLEDMLAHGAGNSFDILALHPYAVPLDPSQARIQSRPEVHKMVDVELNKYRAFLQRHGAGSRPIWVTELGWPAHDWNLDDQQQASYLAQAYAQMLSSGLVERIFWYSFKDESARPGDSWGLIAWGNGKTDLAPRRPAFAAYTTAVRMLSGTTPVGRIQLAPFQIVQDFEQAPAWNRSNHPIGSFTGSREQAHTGAASGKLQYEFTSTDQAVDFAPPQPLPLPGRPTRIGLWVMGDASGNYLSAWLRDKDGELFKVRLGAVTGAADGWRYYEASLNTYYFDWERASGNPANGAVDYPVSFVAFRLENTPDQPPARGTIYVDDLQVYDGPDVSAVRFMRQDGQAVDVLWSLTPATVRLPTASATAYVVDRDGTQGANGAGRAVASSNGMLTLNVSDSPIYVVHKPTEQAEASANQRAGVTLPDAQRSVLNPQPSVLCDAYRRATPVGQPGYIYFNETGHNLGGAFRTYWERNGSLPILGYPITEEFTAPSTDGKPYRQQYFQRARLEYHPENSPPNDIQLGLLGVWLTEGRTFPRSTAGRPPSLFFPQTDQNITLFRDWWSRNGGLALFGYPISPEMQETSPTDGKTYTVQYFERNRFEYHPEHAGTPYEVMLGLLGTEYLARQGCK